MADEDNIVKTKTELLRSLEGQQLKQHIVLDAQDRIKYLFEAPIEAKNNDPCLVTEYVYKDAASTIIIKRQERQYLWKAIWESGAPAFEFDPNTSYDPDGNGVI